MKIALTNFHLQQLFQSLKSSKSFPRKSEKYLCDVFAFSPRANISFRFHRVSPKTMNMWKSFCYNYTAHIYLLLLLPISCPQLFAFMWLCAWFFDSNNCLTRFLLELPSSMQTQTMFIAPRKQAQIWQQMKKYLLNCLLFPRGSWAQFFGKQSHTRNRKLYSFVAHKHTPHPAETSAPSNSQIYYIKL